MRVNDIWEEIVEATGSCDEAVNFRALTRAIELLSNKGLFDPLIGVIDFTVDGGYLIALPRDVKTPLRVNINNNPSFARNRLFEFMPNTDGSNDGEEVGWQWHERGYSPIQDERKLPSKVRYIVTNAADVGSTLTIFGIDVSGYERKETLSGDQHDSTPSQYVYSEVRTITRDATTAEAYLHAETGAIARYYADEEQPEYRVVKISKSGTAVRMMYRKHVFKITSQTDIIPLHSPMAVIRAVDAVRLFQKKKYEDAKIALEEAAQMIREEQNSRDENSNISGTVEIQSAINANIYSNDVLIVADVYDLASDILGPIGRNKIFDRITDALNALGNKAQWESAIGNATICRRLNCEPPSVNSRRCRDGYYTLPRHVGAILALNINGRPTYPRNRWFEYHLNGTGSTRYASCGTWDDLGHSPIINGLPKRRGKVVPTKVLAIPDDATDEGKSVIIYGLERLANGKEVEVWRNGVHGWTCPCQTSGYTLPADAPAFTRIDRIKREATTGFVRLLGYEAQFGSLALVGDVGRDSDAAAAVAAMIRSNNPDQVVLLGDLNYEEDTEGWIVVGSYLGLLAEPGFNEITIEHPIGAPEFEVGAVMRINGIELTIESVVQESPISEGMDYTAFIVFDQNFFTTDPTSTPVEMIGETKTTWDETVDDNLTDHYGDFLTAGKLNAVPGNHEHGNPETQVGRFEDFLEYFSYELPFAFKKTFGDLDVFFLDSDDRAYSGNEMGVIPIGTATAASGNVLFVELNQALLAGTEFWLAGFAYTVLNDAAIDASSIDLVETPSDNYGDIGEMSAAILNQPLLPPSETAASEQYLWFQDAVQNSTAKWKIVVFHHPPFTSGDNHSAQTEMRWNFAELGIHAVLNAHNHVYERIEEDGVYYFTVGTGSNLHDFETVPYVNSKKRVSINGAMFVQHNDRALRFSFQDLDGNVLDSVEITDTSEQTDEVLLGYWYPDELEPNYRLIKLPGTCPDTIRIRYRKREKKITSLHDVINLRSRLALENMFRALATQPTDAAGAMTYEAMAVQYLEEEQATSNPISAGTLQFETETAPGHSDNIQ